MTDPKQERLPSRDGTQKAKAIWENARKKNPTPALINSIEESQQEVQDNEQDQNDRAARRRDSEASL